MITSDMVAEARRDLGRQLADLRRAAGYTQHGLTAPGRLAGYSRSAVANAETGRASLHRGFWKLCDDVLGAGGELLAAYDRLEALSVRHRQESASARQQFGGPPPIAIDAVGDLPENRSGEVGALVAVMIGEKLPGPDEDAMDRRDLADAVSRAKRAYQAGRYDEVINGLPGLLRHLHAAVATAASGTVPRLRVMAADAHQVACSVLLKRGEVPLAVLAADRSKSEAEASGEPLAIAASARAVTHALLASGHHRQAIEFALAAAQNLRDAAGLSAPSAASVYGALLLRAAIATAHGGDRSSALHLLEEADAQATGLGQDANAYWTYFNGINVALHRVHVATSLGDAGNAIDLAGRIDLELVPLAERRACLFLDVARAFTQWGKYGEAFHALCVVEQTAPQEAASSRARELMLDLERRSPASVRGRLHQLAHRIGAYA